MSSRTGAVASAIESLMRLRVAADGGAPDVLTGLVGRGIQLSRSPAMHEREAARQGLRCAYVLLDFDALGLGDGDLPLVIEACAALGFQGVNVTHPFKQQVIPLLDELAPEAGAIGAVNTVVFGDRVRGHNTDCWGFANSFRGAMNGASLERVALLGAGGAGSAVAYALIELGARHIAVIDSEAERAGRLVERLSAMCRTRLVPAADVSEAIAKADGVVNTTPVGMDKYPGTPVPVALLRPHHWVADVIYFPQETELLRQARAMGCSTLSGIGMAIGQAVRAFELFTGRSADIRAMTSHFEAAA